MTWYDVSYPQAQPYAIQLPPTPPIDHTPKLAQSAVTAEHSRGPSDPRWALAKEMEPLNHCSPHHPRELDSRKKPNQSSLVNRGVLSPSPSISTQDRGQTRQIKANDAGLDYQYASPKLPFRSPVSAIRGRLSGQPAQNVRESICY